MLGEYGSSDEKENTRTFKDGNGGFLENIKNEFDGILEIKTNYKTDKRTGSHIMKFCETNVYNPTKRNCSDLGSLGVSSSLGLLGTKASILLGKETLFHKMFTTPNQLYKDTRGLWGVTEIVGKDVDFSFKYSSYAFDQYKQKKQTIDD